MKTWKIGNKKQFTFISLNISMENAIRTSDERKKANNANALTGLVYEFVGVLSSTMGS